MHPEQDSFIPICLPDIAAGDQVSFSLFLFLPKNNKYIKILNAGENVSPETFGRLQKNQVSILFISKADHNEFIDYCAQKVVDLTDPDSALSSTDRANRLQSHVGGLMNSLISGEVEEKNKEQFENQVFAIVDRLIEKQSQTSLSQLLSQTFLDSGLESSHASSVASLAALVSVLTGVGNAKNVALAGLFHDIALSDNGVNPRDYFRSFYQHSDNIPNNVFDHPIQAAEVLKRKKILLNREVIQIIEQHHERFNGTGYPHSLKGEEIIPEAQILQVADKIVSMGQYIEGEVRHTPLQVIEMIGKEEVVSPLLFSCVKKLFSDI